MQKRYPAALRNSAKIASPKKSTPVSELILARAATVQGKLGTVHPDNQTSDSDLKKGPQVHLYQAVRQQEKLDEEINQRRRTIQDLAERLQKLQNQLADGIKEVTEHCLDPLKKPLRELFFMERSLIEARIDYEEGAMESLQKRIEYIRRGLDSLANADHSVSASFLLGSRSYLASDPFLSLKRLFIPVTNSSFFSSFFFSPHLEKYSPSPLFLRSESFTRRRFGRSRMPLTSRGSGLTTSSLLESGETGFWCCCRPPCG